MTADSGGSVEEVEVATWSPGKPHRGGIQNGRNWHYRSTTWTGSYHLTACGKRFWPNWSPGYRNHDAKTCTACEKVWTAQVGPRQ